MKVLVLLLGLLFFSPSAVAEDAPTLAELQAAADVGDVESQAALGVRYLNGDGVEHNRGISGAAFPSGAARRISFAPNPSPASRCPSIGKS